MFSSTLKTSSYNLMMCFYPRILGIKKFSYEINGIALIKHEVTSKIVFCKWHDLIDSKMIFPLLHLLYGLYSAHDSTNMNVIYKKTVSGNYWQKIFEKIAIKNKQIFWFHQLSFIIYGWTRFNKDFWRTNLR